MAKANGLELAQVIATLRDELERAIDEGKGRTLRFALEEAHLELKVGVTQSGQGKAGIKLWVLDAEASAQMASEVVQTIKLTLRPHHTDAVTGQVTKVEISESLEERPR